MKNYLAGLDKDILKMIRQIGKIADSQHLSAYIVGGIVRDIILRTSENPDSPQFRLWPIGSQRERNRRGGQDSAQSAYFGRQNFDLDVVVEGDCSELASTVAKIVGARLTRYEQFKTASLYLPSGVRIDLATARSEFYAHSGALPKVKEGILKSDLFRRDFTINTLAVCINKNKFGQLIDQFNGLEDLRRRRVRILHDESFVDDPTRILRAVRFEQRFGFRIEEKTLQFLKKALNNHLTKNVKPPRYFAEFKKILSESKPLKYVKRLDRLGGFKFIAPGLKIEYNVLRRLEQRLGQGDCKLPAGVEKWLLYFMAVVQNLSADALERILAQFHFRKDDQEAVLAVRRGKEFKKTIFSPKLSRGQVYEILRPLPLPAVFYLWFLELNPAAFSHLKHFLKKDRQIHLAIDGNDLKKLGLESGPAIGKILGQVLREKINGKVSSKKEELNLANTLLP